MTGTLNLAGSTCEGCHMSGMSSLTDALAPADVPQVTAVHGDPGTAHDDMWPTTYCGCHGTDPVAIHGGTCTTCHPTGGPAPAPGSTCLTCHPNYHSSVVSTPASSNWSLALVIGLGFGAGLVAIRRTITAA